DDDIGNAVGTVAFWNGAGVCLVEGQVKGFDSLIDLRAEVNKSDGRILNVAPGDYEGLGANTYNSSVTILGPNAGRSPHIRYVNDAWAYNAGGRLEEAVIHGDLRFATAGASSIDRITVKGLKFVGESYWGPIGINDVRKSDSISPQGFITKLDISFNIFEGWGTQGNAAAVWANTRVQKTGIMEHNWFNCTKNSSVEGYYARAVFMRNINGLVIENNRFSGYDTPFFLTSEITAGDTTPGHLNLTVSSNRFEYCDRSLHYFRNLYGGTTAHLKYLDNTFVRCGFNSAVFYLDMGETSAACGNNYAKCSLDLIGNRFFGCGRAIALYRKHLTDDGTTSLTGDLSQMTVNITQNVFYDPLERPPGEGFAGLSGPATASIYCCFVVKPNGAYGGTLGSKWKMSHNYFYSARLALDYSGTAVNNPDLYCCNYYSKGTGDSGKSFSDSGKFAPYYTAWSNNAFTALSSGSIQNMNVTAANYNGTYDGQPHTFTVTAPAGATVAYSTNASGTAGAAYQTTPVTRTAVGTTQVAYRVTCPGYTTVYGAASITITKGAAVTTTIPDKTVTYTGGEHRLASFTALRPGDTLRYLYGGAAYETMPAFCGVGIYTVGIEVTNPNYNTYSKTATLTILPASLEDVEISGGYEGVYDGALHTVYLEDLPDGVEAEYAVDGGEWSTIPPMGFKEITDGPHTVTIRLSGRNYVERTETLTFNITPATITGVTLTAAVGLTENGEDLIPVTLTGTQEGDTVRYSVNGGPLQTKTPAVTRAGRYTVAAVITRVGHADKTLVTDVTVAPGALITPAVFAPVIQKTAVIDTDGATQFRWTVAPGMGSEFSLAETADFKVLAYGLYHAAEREHLEDYLFYARYGKTDRTTDLSAEGKVTEVIAAQNDTGLTTLYAEYELSADNVPALSAQYAAFFIRFEMDGVVYEQYSEIQSVSALPGGIV
ncbi:MAG: hypothetical protein IJN42_06250, partial [Clostridia bacterium]|nr:hypothetical protein [Clostridia bacterium]